MNSRVAAMSVAVAALAATGGCSIFGSSTAKPVVSAQNSGGDETGGIGVNAFLWRASLDTLSFMPLSSADPYGGVITTDWYANPELPNERFKITVYILDTRLRADGLSASVFKETLADGQWRTAAVNPDVALAIENSILSRARQLRLSTIDE